MQQDEKSRKVTESGGISGRYPAGTDLSIPVDASDASTIMDFNPDIFPSKFGPKFDRNFEVNHASSVVDLMFFSYVDWLIENDLLGKLETCI